MSLSTTVCAVGNAGVVCRNVKYMEHPAAAITDDAADSPDWTASLESVEGGQSPGRSRKNPVGRLARRLLADLSGEAQR